MSEREFGSIGGRGGRSRPRLARDLTRSQLLRGPKDADWTCVKRAPIILWQSVVAFAPRESGAERWQYSLAIRFERAVHTEKGEVVKLAVVLTEH